MLFKRSNLLPVVAIVLALSALIGPQRATASEEPHPCEGSPGIGCCACHPTEASCKPTTNDAHLECLPIKGACYGECEGAA
jgi:hypothetical protein